jgi:hypothetical protein
MESSAGAAFLERKSVFWFVAALAIVLFAITNLPWHLDEYDQAKQAFTSFEMVKQEHWIYQHTPNGWVATKPPLVGWISAGLFTVTRSWDLAWRLPSFLAGLALLFLIARAGAVYGAAAALIAASAFGLNLFAPRLAMFRKREKLRAVTVACCTIAIVIACLFTTGYAAGKIVLGYHNHSDAFASFGKAVRQEAAAHNWSYAVVGGEDEGMLLYVRRTEFLDPDQAATQWNVGALDGLVVPDDELTDLLPRLTGAVPSRIGMSEPAGRYRKRYIFLVRS